MCWPGSLPCVPGQGTTPTVTLLVQEYKWVPGSCQGGVMLGNLQWTNIAFRKSKLHATETG